MSELFYILSSAASIAACAFLVQFFGGSIADQQPYSDDRKWDTLIYGVNFLMATIFWSIIGYALARYIPLPLDGFWQRYAAFTVISILVGLLYLINGVLGKEYYNLKVFIAFKYLPKKFIIPINSAIHWIDFTVPLPAFTLVAFFILTKFYLSGHVVWIAIATIEAFICIWYSAVRYSFHMLQKLLRATIHITYGEPLHDVDVLKVNPTNIRIRENEKIIIINMDFVKFIEIDGKKQKTS